MSTPETLEEIAGVALRYNKRGSFENMIANHLALSVNAEHLHKITLVIEACYMSNLEKLEIEKKTLDKLYSLALSFLGTNPNSNFVSIPWNFTETEQNFKEYISEWFTEIPLNFSTLTELERQKKTTELNKLNSDYERFFKTTKELNLKPSSLNILKGMFIRWALPQIMIYFEKLSRTIDPMTYQNILSGIRGEQQQK